MRKLLALTLSLLLVFAAIPMTMASADTMTATHVYTMDAGSRIAGGNTRYHWGAGYADIGGDHGYVFRLETKSDAYSYFALPANWSTDYGKVTKISFELGGATKGILNSPAVCLATAKDSNYKYSGTAIRGLWKNVEFKAGSWTTVEIDVSDKDTFFVDGTEARYMCLGAQKSLGVQNSSDSAKGWMYIDNVTLTYEYEADLPEYDVTIDGEVVDTVMETKTFTVPTPAEGYHYSDGVVDYFGGEEITVTAPVALVSVINTYDVTIEGTVADTVAHGGIFTVPAPATGYQYSDGANLYDGGEEITVTGPVELTTVVATTKDVYTMDEGSRLPEAKSYAYLAGVTVDRNAEYIEVNGNYKLALKAQMDKCAYIKLPSDWASKPYYKPTKITFTVSKSLGSLAFKNLKLASAIENNYVPSGETHDVITSTSYVNPTTYSIDITEDMYDCFYISGQLYATSEWSETNPSYVYYDNVTIDYEYDFDYVEPTYYDVTIDGEVVTTVVEGDTFTLPALEAGKYYVGGYEAGQEFTVTEALSFTTATYTFDITVDGEVVATVEYGTEYTLPALADGKYYVDVTDTTFVVTEALSFTTATYTFDITIDGTVVATVAYGETFTLPAVAEGKQYVDGFVAGQEFVVTEALAFATEDIPEVDGPTTDLVETVDGAAIRLNEAKGMRFYANFKGNLDEVDRMGIIIAPKDLVGDYFTMEDDHIDVVYKHKTYDLWKDNQFVGSIVNIADKNITRDFIARAYVVIDGVTYYAETTTVRNIADIADEFITDPEGNYNSLEADVKELVQTWAKAND